MRIQIIRIMMAVVIVGQFIGAGYLIANYVVDKNVTELEYQYWDGLLINDVYRKGNMFYVRKPRGYQDILEAKGDIPCRNGFIYFFKLGEQL